jgi:glycosyltransferase involved in cell wall biosynthesis
MTRKPETALAAIALGVPTILENHVPFEYFPHLKERLEYFSSPLLKAVVVVSEGLAEEHVRAGLPEDRIIFEHDGVDLSQYSLVGDRRALRRELGWDDRPRVVYTGHLFEERAIDVAIKAAAAAEDVEFVFVGGWPEDLARCEKLAAGLANVVFTGFVEHAKVARYQAAADVLLMQYSLDAHHADRCSPLKLFEYMASGRPMIATDMPTLEGLLNHGENCLLVPPGSSGALAAAVKKLVKEPLLGEKLAEQARLDVEYYDWDLRAKRILDAALKDVG